MDRLLFRPDCAGGPADRRRKAGGAGGKHTEAGALLAKRTDDSGSGLSGCRVSVLGRIVRAGEDPALYRRQAARRNAKGSEHAGRSGKLDETGGSTATDERQAIRQVRSG